MPKFALANAMALGSTRLRVASPLAKKSCYFAEIGMDRYGLGPMFQFGHDVDNTLLRVACRRNGKSSCEHWPARNRKVCGTQRDGPGDRSQRRFEMLDKNNKI